LICPERSQGVSLSNYTLDSSFIETLKEIDKKILHERDNSAFNKIKIGIDQNFRLPSITQYIFSQTTSREDLLTVIMQLRSDGKIRRIISEIEEITSTAKGAGRFEKDIQKLVKRAFGQKSDTESISISVSAFFVNFSKSINLDFFRRKEYFVFLKDLIACRTEAYRVEKDFKRIFEKKLKP
jgi:hypothetical protein